MRNYKIVAAIVILLIIVVGGAYLFANLEMSQTPTTSTTSTTTVQAQTYGMNEYTDPNYGFSFWYPSELQVTASTTNDSVSFPGGVAVETLQVGQLGGTSVVVVNSPSSMITDEPANHASPIPQTEYFYDASSSEWMVAYPQGGMTTQYSPTTTADISKTTIGNLYMLPSGKRFDTTIVPLSKTMFLVISDGGGSSFTTALAATVAQSSYSVSISAQNAVLEAESAAYAQGGNNQ